MLAGELEPIWQRAREAWPTVEVARERFGQFLDERMARGGGALDRLKTNDLYLACACLDGDGAALRSFGALLDEVGNKLRHMARSDDMLEEARQRVRQVVVARVDGEAPLGDYSGIGELGGWLRVALARELIRLARRGAREQPAAADQMAALVDSDDDPEIVYLKTHYQNEFREAFTAAMERLEASERRALRYSIVDRLSIDEIARIDGVHRATAARQVARARARLTEETRRALGERLQIGTDELHSILRLIESQVDVSVRRLLVEE
jgi:RNA polymerase sigma-70 factor (ECF subfamily)